MSAFPNPLSNIANPLLQLSWVRHRSRHEQIDPQAGILIDQDAQERRSFQFDVLEKRIDQATQQASSIQPINSKVEVGEVLAGPIESPEIGWLVENRTALETYRGEWLLIFGRLLVAHSTDFAEIRQAIANRGIRSPFVYYVPAEEESNFIAF
jgi:hypothetical protein